MKRKSNKPKVLMIGADRDGNGGVASVVNQYYTSGLDSFVDLKYIPTMKEGNKLKKIIVMLKALAVFIKSIKDYDILHVHMSKGASFFRKSIFINIAQKYNIKVIIHIHSGAIDKFYYECCNDLGKKYFRKVFTRSDKIIVLSQKCKSFFLSICGEEKIIILPNAVFLSKCVKKDYSSPKVLMLGRLGKNKGTYDLLNAIPYVVEKILDVQFYLGGDGEIDYCKRLSKTLGVEDHVNFMGWVSGEEKIEILKKCSVFILPSYHEGLPMSLLEAMSCGEVVITTAVGGIPEVIQDGINGYIIEAGNIEEISQRLVYVLTAANREAIGKAAQKTIAENFDIKKNIYKLLSLYEELLSNKC